MSKAAVIRSGLAAAVLVGSSIGSVVLSASATASVPLGRTAAQEDPVTTTVVVPRTTVPALEERVTESQAATTRLNRVVIGLILLAVVITAATVYFWIRTRPNRVGSTHRRRGATIVAADGSESPVTARDVGEFFASEAERR